YARPCRRPFPRAQSVLFAPYAPPAPPAPAAPPPPAPVPPACLIAAAVGYLSNKAFFRFTRNNLVNGLLVSIGLISIFESASMLLWTATPVEMHFVLPGALRVGDIGLPKMKLVVFAVIVIVIVATYLALARTWLGRAAFAYAQNPEAAMLLGVHT